MGLPSTGKYLRVTLGQKAPSLSLSFRVWRRVFCLFEFIYLFILSSMLGHHLTVPKCPGREDRLQNKPNTDLVVLIDFIGKQNDK